jgi:hypothetical protein
VVSGTYTDGEVKPETDYSLTGTGTGTLGEKTVTLTLERDGKTFTVTFPIIVRDESLLSITITRKPDKTIYLWQEELDLSGLVVKGQFSNMLYPVTLPILPENISYNKTQSGEQTVLVTVEDQSAGFPVTVKTPKLYFDYGRRISELDPSIESAPELYTCPPAAASSLPW